ncbi:MAG TPA: TetR/AcrR family transcriptional regulator [Caldimonas sp.]|nr:TetR/AcrR family transcriptional regulator [Caldimonas sp.]
MKGTSRSGQRRSDRHAVETRRSAQKAESRERIVRAAAASVRREGFAGTGVAEVMGEAGLTHGGFYAHFPSREALLAAAADGAGADGVAQLARIAAAAPAGGGLAAIAEAYLSDRHVERAERGCPIVAVGSELARQAPSVRHAATGRIKEMVDLIERQDSGWGEAGGHARALARLSCMVGAMVLARAVDDPDLSRAVREAASDAITGTSR